MDITLNSFCTQHDKRDCHFQQQNKLVYLKEETSVSDFRPLKWGDAVVTPKSKLRKKNNKRMVWH